MLPNHLHQLLFVLFVFILQDTILRQVDAFPWNKTSSLFNWHTEARWVKEPIPREKSHGCLLKANYVVLINIIPSPIYLNSNTIILGHSNSFSHGSLAFLFSCKMIKKSGHHNSWHLKTVTPMHQSIKKRNKIGGWHERDARRVPCSPTNGRSPPTCPAP
jgi:hypothetical protein